VPKVSSAHLEARRQQILGAARACFARRGFHQATMQDICQEAGVSAGAVYRYFAGKDALIDALRREDLARNTALIAVAGEERDFLALIDRMVAEFFDDFDVWHGCGPGDLGIEMLAEAMRNPTESDAARHDLAALRAAFTDIIRAAQARREIAATLAPEAVSVMALSFYFGLLIQKTVDPTIQVADYVAVMKALLRGEFRPTDAPVRAVAAAV